MKCQIQLSGEKKNKHVITLSSADFSLSIGDISRRQISVFGTFLDEIL